MLTIPTNIEFLLIRERNETGRYWSNRELNYFITFAKLKAVTKSGCIKYTSGERKTPFLQRIGKEIGVSYNCLSSHLLALSKMGFVKHQIGESIKLTSWEKVCQWYCTPYEGTIEIETLTKQKLYGLGIKNKKIDMWFGYQKKFKELVELLPCLFDSYTPNELPAPEQLADLQEYLFVNGCPDKDFLAAVFAVNPRFEMSVQTWATHFHHKNRTSVYYWFRKMVKDGIIERGEAKVLTSPSRVRTKQSKYNKRAKVSFLPLCSTITLKNLN